MAKWDDEDDEEEQHVTRGRLGRFLKLGGLTTKVGVSVMGDRIIGRLLSEEGRKKRTKKNLERNAARVVKTMGEMKGAAMKLGQMLSVAPLDEEQLPTEVKDALAVLQRSAPPMKWSMVVRQIEQAFDRPVSEVYRFFDDKPLAAASIGQVHRAETFDGRIVAVKVQYPDVTETLDSDMKNLASMIQVGRAVAEKERLDAYMKEVREVILAESDYRLEAKNLQKYHDLLKTRDDVRVPQPLADLTRKTVLTMEYIEGEKLDEWLLAQTEEVRDRKALDFIELFAWMFHDLQALHADPHPGNFLIDPDGRFVLLDWGAAREFTPMFTDGFLELLIAMWDEKYEKLPSIYEDLGFGSEERGVTVKPEVLRGWLELVAAPFFTDHFDWGTWFPHAEVRKYLLSHMEMMKLTPPAQGIFYFRVAGGCWGFLQRMGVKGNFQHFALETAKRRGLL